jgi:iron(III) transport system ATP-binding protein
VSALHVDGVSKAYGSTAVLRGIDLKVASGTLTAVLGLSGAGKTTLLRILAGFERSDRGSVTLSGRVVDGVGAYVTPERRGVGYVPQEGALFPNLSVTANVTFGLPRAQRRAGGGAELLELVGMSALGDRFPHQLSGGEQQRVALARALARGPELLLLDEPFASLDASLRASVRSDVLTLLRGQQITTVMVTHDQEEALSMADRVAVLRDGVIAQDGSPEELYRRPVDVALARFLGATNVVSAEIRDGFAHTELGILAVEGAPTATGTVMLRPEQLEVHLGAAATGLAGRVARCEYYGHDAVIQVACDSDGSQLLVRVDGDRALPPGTAVTVSASGMATVVS